MSRQPMFTTEQLIAAAVDKFTAPRGEKTIWAGARRVKVHTPGERSLILPNGHKVKITVDDSGKATHIEEDEALHAIARPDAIALKLNQGDRHGEAHPRRRWRR